ncbi:MAG: hypothetical protein ACJAZO_001898 [Myxococcota bacterium]|jgi:hypothetical protein
MRFMGVILRVNGRQYASNPTHPPMTTLSKTRVVGIGQMGYVADRIGQLWEMTWHYGMDDSRRAPPKIW